MQPIFLTRLIRKKVLVDIHLVNGINLKGKIVQFDSLVVILKHTVHHMIYKHAISTIQIASTDHPPRTLPSKNIKLKAQGGSAMKKS
jgi:host factor-I protein